MIDSTLPPDLAAALEDEAIELWVHLHSGRATAAERMAFNAWSQRSPAHQAAAQMAQDIWAALPATAAAQTVRQPLPAPRRGRRLWISGAVAASLAAVALVINTLGPVARLYADYTTAVGERHEVQLEDGSRIWLNSASALSVDYSAERRSIHLYQGEALFQVAKDAQRPFIVHAADGEVRAVGTRFDVDLRGDQVGVRVSEGIVQVDSGGTPARLTVGQGLSYQQGQAPGAVTQLDVASADAWQRGKLIFNSRPLGEVLAELERYLPGKLYLTDGQLAELRVSGLFELDDPAALLRTLEQTQPLRITRLPLLTLVRPAG
ncbi:MAG: FecR family protein [Pseudomonas sp.]